MVVNSRQNGREISATSRLKRDEIGSNAHGRRENFCRTDLARFPVWTSAGEVRDALRLPPEFTTIAHNQSLLKWFLRQSMVVLLTIHANCLLFAPKSANPSRLLPSPPCKLAPAMCSA